MKEELVCPNCKEKGMVSLECVFQTYPVYYSNGKLEFEGRVLKEWYNDAEPPSIFCNNCSIDFSRKEILENMKILSKKEEE